jgi:putative protein-disulfide isomerase
MIASHELAGTSAGGWLSGIGHGAAPVKTAPTLVYVHDPMCSWCWAFRPAWDALRARLPPEVGIRRLLGGLAPDTDAPMPLELRERIQGYWRRIQAQVPGTEFNYAFWERCTPRRATHAACRAVIAARRQDPAQEEPMCLAIQRAYYQEARNPSEEETLVDLAARIGLDPGRIAADLDAPDVQAELQAEMGQAAALGVWGFPSLILIAGDAPASAAGAASAIGRAAAVPRQIRIDYRDPEAMLRDIAAPP